VSSTSGLHQRADRSPISPIEGIMLGAMAAIVIAIAIPSYTAMEARSHDSTARAHVGQAAAAVEAFRSEHGTYAGANGSSLRPYDPTLKPSSYRLARVSKTRYCVESSSAGRTWHIEGPAGDVTRGACS
jgi:Tfp pilus assembly protein PilE